MNLLQGHTVESFVTALGNFLRGHEAGNATCAHCRTSCSNDATFPNHGWVTLTERDVPNVPKAMTVWRAAHIGQPHCVPCRNSIVEQWGNGYAI